MTGCASARTGPLPGSPSINRRQFLSRSLAVAGAGSAAIGFYTWRVEPHWLQLVERALPIRRLPRDLRGKVLAQLSDLHVGRVDPAYLERTFARVRARRPDIVVFTGDFISYDAADPLGQLGVLLEQYPLGRLGTVAVLGNHDYGPAWAHPEIAAAVVALAERAGITVLRNQMADCGGLQVVGLDDLWAHRFSPHEGLDQADPQGATIALSHNPDTVDRIGWERYHGWVLAGHTHGGQCKPPFLPPPILPVENRRYTAGDISLSGDRRLYISRGVGHLLRVRFNVRPEVTLFRLEG